MMANVEHPGLSPRLSAHVRPEDLARNADVMRAEIDRIYPGLNGDQIEAVRSQLLRLPLIHVSDSNTFVSMQQDGIQPHAMRPEGSINSTFPVDESLGLDTYVFHVWGEANRQYGRYSQAVDPKLLLSPNTVVTPYDISVEITDDSGPVRRTQLFTRFEELDGESQNRIRSNYFGRMVTGWDWLDIKAREVLGRIAQRSGDPVELNRINLGEVKHRGVVPPEMLGETHVAPFGGPSLDLEEKLAKLGFIPFGVAVRRLDAAGPDAATARRYYQAARAVWQEILGIKR